MGEAPAFFFDDLHGDFQSQFELELKGHQTSVTTSCNRTYFIGASKNKASSTIGVQIFDRSTGEWMIPTVLGIVPRFSEGHATILLDDERILVITENASSGDCFWFLETDTPFVRVEKMKLRTEVVAWSKGVIGETEKPIVISGPSGVGKGTIINKLMEEYPSMFGFSVSHTTRAPRNHEQNGVHYHFTERSVMEKDIEEGRFLEFAAVHGNLYGTSVESVEFVADKGKRCILDIDVQGARSVRASSLEAIFIFVCPPSSVDLEKRLRARGTETEEQIQKRLRNAKAELEQGNSPGLFDHILVNDDLETCYGNLKKLLGFNTSIKISQTPSSELFHLPQHFTTTKIKQKILITCGASDHEKSASNIFMLDISSIKDGAPGLTRGLNFYRVSPSTNGINGV